MLAASARPDLVRSLCLIQPGALRVAEDEPVVRDMLTRTRPSTASLPADLTAADYLRLSTEPLGMSTPPATRQRLRVAWTSMGERPCWDAETDLDPLAAASWPASVIVGDWAGAPAEYRRLAGEPLTAAARVLAERIGAELLTVPGFYPQTQQPDAIDDALATLWAVAS